MRALDRELAAIAHRIIRNEKRGREQNPADLRALRDTVDEIIGRLEAGK